jgi:hypothetical protein
MAYFSTFTAENQEQLCTQMYTAHLCCWCYRMLHTALPPQAQNKFRTSYLYRAVQTAHQQKMKEELFDLFEKNQIRFAPIKGADVAFELYQDPVTRYFCDLDILLHPEDSSRALEILTGAQWLEVSHKTLADSHHHFTMRIKNKVALEPHRTLPSFENVPVSEIWQHIHPVNPGEYRHKLEPELQLLLLIRHARSHYEEPVYKLLLDAAHILKYNHVDMSRLTNLAKQWHFPDPGSFLAAFPEFFPEDEICMENHDPQAAKLFRELFEHASAGGNLTHQHIVVSGDIWSKRWWKNRFSGISLRTLRNKYKLPRKGAYLRLTAVFLLDVIRKTGMFLCYVFRRNEHVKDFGKTLKKLDNHEH